MSSDPSGYGFHRVEGVRHLRRRTRRENPIAVSFVAPVPNIVCVVEVAVKRLPPEDKGAGISLR